MTDWCNGVPGVAGGVAQVYNGPAGFFSLGSKEFGMNFGISGAHSPYSPPMLWFISCSYRVYLGMKPKDWAALCHTDINWGVDCEPLQVAEIKLYAGNLSALIYGSPLVAGLKIKIWHLKGTQTCVCVRRPRVSVCTYCTNYVCVLSYVSGVMWSCRHLPWGHNLRFGHDNCIQREG